MQSRRTHIIPHHDYYSSDNESASCNSRFHHLGSCSRQSLSKSRATSGLGERNASSHARFLLALYRPVSAATYMEFRDAVSVAKVPGYAQMKLDLPRPKGYDARQHHRNPQPLQQINYRVGPRNLFSLPTTEPLFISYLVKLYMHNHEPDGGIMTLSRDEQIAEYGWTALPCDPAQWGGDKGNNRDPVPQLCSQVHLPDTPLVKAAMDHVKAELSEHTFNHSMRVFYYGTFVPSYIFDKGQKS